MAQPKHTIVLLQETGCRIVPPACSCTPPRAGFARLLRARLQVFQSWMAPKFSSPLSKVVAHSCVGLGDVDYLSLPPSSSAGSRLHAR